MPDGSSAVDEGFVLLPGCVETEYEHLWRLVHLALRSRQRAVQLGAVSPAPLPVWRTSFVGRAEDVASVGARLDARRLVTLVGPAGVGKTRLAAAVAAAASVRTYFVDLTLATKDANVDALVADAVGSSQDSEPRKGIEAPAQLGSTVLDNREHVLTLSPARRAYCRVRWSSVLATVSGAGAPDEDSLLHPGDRVGGAAMQLFDRAGSPSASYPQTSVRLTRSAR